MFEWELELSLIESSVLFELDLEFEFDLSWSFSVWVRFELETDFH